MPYFAREPSKRVCHPPLKVPVSKIVSWQSKKSQDKAKEDKLKFIRSLKRDESGIVIPSSRGAFEFKWKVIWQEFNKCVW